MTDKSTPGTQFTDADVRAILRRAAEIDSSGALSESDLREIAKEANISQNAVNRAMAEMQEKRLEAIAEDRVVEDIARAAGPGVLMLKIGAKGLVLLVAGVVIAFWLMRVFP